MTGAFLNLCFFEAFNVLEQHERQLGFESGPLHDSRTCLLVRRGLSSLPGGYLVLQGCLVVLVQPTIVAVPFVPRLWVEFCWIGRWRAWVWVSDEWIP